MHYEERAINIGLIILNILKKLSGLIILNKGSSTLASNIGFSSLKKLFRHSFPIRVSIIKMGA
jgi:hypothetical protein